MEISSGLNDPRAQCGGAFASGAGGPDAHHAIGHRAAGRRASVAVSQDAAALWGGRGEAAEGGVCVRGGQAICNDKLEVH